MDPLVNEIVLLLRTRKTASGWTPTELAAALGISRARVHRGLDELRALGYELTAGRNESIRITCSPDRMIDTEILAGLKTRIFARQLYCYNRIGSTNARALELAEAKAPEGTIVVAEEQTSGRGRLGRVWHSPPGLGIWASFILRPQLPLQKAAGVSLLAALAFAQTVEDDLALKVDLKWPNDGLIAGRKVFGVLTEVSAEVDRVYYVVCGTGINVAHRLEDFPPALRQTAGSLAHACGCSVDRLAFFRSFLTHFEAVYRRFRRDGLAPFLTDYRDRSLLLGRDVTVHHGQKAIQGQAVAIDDHGALILRTATGDITVVAGEATLREQ